MNDGSKLEKHVQRVYSFLLNMKDEGIVVGQDVQLVDKFGRSHQVDVFFQFEKAGITHKVAIECKDHGRPIDNGQVAKFYGKLNHAGNIQKVMVSRLGYQQLAKDLAKDNDVLLLTIDDLPRINELLAERLQTVALPDETTVGEPFWTIMELSNGKNNGSFFAHPNPSSGQLNMLLFYSKQHAERAFSEGQLDKGKWGIRGMPQYVFKAFLLQLELFESRNYSAAILMRPPGTPENVPFISVPASRADLIKEYYEGELPSIMNGI
ncbi:restriction endonuclease [Shewanella sp. SR43-4]|uniref:restriction endonuclease n=1 Tax=Shewanella sp. SR43-4 TaxID=2760942 RepID=UPI0015F89034|nr:restriction endonuclease [Shewanella sp. SR43-4]MBB1319375.1 restriction endonuclease [Shewanella sp. SR43-4]